MREDFKELVIKFFARESSENEIEILRTYLDEDEECRRFFNQINELWQESDLNDQFHNLKTEEGWKRISAKLGLGRKNQNSVFIIKKNKFRILLAAASFACLMAIGGFTLWLLERKSAIQILAATTKVFTKEGEKAHIYLTDSTQVFINSGSTLIYGANYNTNERKVKLSGEAYFDVRTNPDKPFIVQLDQMTILATGTSFNVLSYVSENHTETTLEKGELQVTVKGEKTLNVKPGQQVIYFAKTNNVVLQNVFTEIYTSWKENKLRLVDTPFDESLRRIARRYNVTFEIQNSELLDLRYTATFIDESIEEVMQMLKTVSPITYKIYYQTTISDNRYIKPNIVVR